MLCQTNKRYGKTLTGNEIRKEYELKLLKILYTQGLTDINGKRCVYCGNNSCRFDIRGRCMACGAPIGGDV